MAEARLLLAALIAASMATVGCSRPSRPYADLIVTNATIWTGNAAQPSASAVAVIGDRIVDVGSDDEISGWRGGRTVGVDAAARRLVPGFNDANLRFVDGGAQLDQVDLTDAGSAAEFARRINERAKAKPGEWILGGRWNTRSWTPRELPHRSLIDEITNSSPVFVISDDGRMALANAAALGRAGITEQTPDPAGGAIVRDSRSFPTGILHGTAMELVTRVIPVVTADGRLRAVKRAVEYAESLGITSVQDVGAVYEDIAAYAELANRNELTVRVYALPAEAGWYDQAKLGLHRAFGSPWLRIGGVRAQVDPGRDPSELQTRLMAADHAGLQLNLSAIDPASAGSVLDALEAIARANGGRDRRFRFVGTRIAPAEVSRLSSLNAVAVLRPAAGGTPPNILRENGIRVALGSGWPSAPLNPMATLAAAIAAGATTAEALDAATSGSAFAEFQDGEKGTIARGQRADMVILSADILAVPLSQVKELTVLTTIAGGKVVHQRNP